MIDDPFAKLGETGLDRQLFQKPQLPPQQKPVIPKVDKSTSIHVDKATKSSASPSPTPQIRKQVKESVEPYSTKLEPSLVKRIKQYALDHDENHYDVVRLAIIEFLDRNK